MPELALLEPEVLPAPCADPVVGKPLVLKDEKGRFLKGNAPGPGRPKGMKNAIAAYERAAPKLAKAYIRKALDGDSSLLKDAREWIMPVEQSANGDEIKAFQIVFATLPLAQSATPSERSPSSFTEPTLSDLPRLVNPQRESLPVGSAEPTTLLKSQPMESSVDALGHA